MTEWIKIKDEIPKAGETVLVRESIYQYSPTDKKPNLYKYWLATLISPSLTDKRIRPDYFEWFEDYARDTKEVIESHYWMRLPLEQGVETEE